VPTLSRPLLYQYEAADTLDTCSGYHMVEICSGGKPGTPKVMQDLMKAMFMSMLKER
jgi:hypothetical protein